MDNLTHSLTCVALSRAFGKRVSAHATVLLLLAGNVPDIDVVTRFRSTAYYLHHHRGITHSLVAAPLLALGVVGIVLAARKLARSTQPFRPGAAYGLALFGVIFAHLFLDWCTSYGTRLLAPFSWRWLAWDAIPILDLWLLVALTAGLTLPALFHLISEEIGARRGKGRGGAVFALVFLLAWFGFRGLLHSCAVQSLDSHNYRGLPPQRVAAFADLGNPFRWRGVVQTAESWEVAEVNSFDEFDPSRARTYYPPESSAALDAARQTWTARIFLDFARFPFSYVEQTDRGYEVVMRDLRFEDSLGGAKGFVCRVVLNRELAVLHEDFHFRPDKPVR